MLGLSSPPFGTLLFVVSGISGTKLSIVIKGVIPMYMIMCSVLLLITYVVAIVLWLPKMLGAM